ncbi:hypothetical protein NXS19_002848 [Fusarium pseudograminearum]|nr:hypothetical protein NXS19_002848 [Fusarium pseudograminearum]
MAFHYVMRRGAGSMSDHALFPLLQLDNSATLSGDRAGCVELLIVCHQNLPNITRKGFSSTRTRYKGQKLRNCYCKQVSSDRASSQVTQIQGQNEANNDAF